MIQFNGNMEKPGIYMNPQGVRLLGYGQVITPGPSAAQLFGAAPATLPAGASAAPVATAAPAGYGQAPAQQPQYAAPVAQPQQFAFASPAPAPAATGATPGNFQFASGAATPGTAQPVAAPAGTAYPFNPDPRFLTGQ
jgi:hypothetical protein